MIFQQYALFPWLTVRKNVEFGLKTARVAKAERRERAQHFIEMVGLEQFADALPKMLSGGMRQRCAIARAYAVNPSILLMDEPFGALDALTRVKLQEQLLDTWSQEQRTVMFITHDVDEAVFLANRVIVMAARPGPDLRRRRRRPALPAVRGVPAQPRVRRAAQPGLALGLPPGRPHRRRLLNRPCRHRRRPDRRTSHVTRHASSRQPWPLGVAVCR